MHKADATAELGSSGMTSLDLALQAREEAKGLVAKVRMLYPHCHPAISPP